MNKISYNFSEKANRQKLQFLIAQIKLGFFQKKGFLLLTDINPTGKDLRESTIIIPEDILEFLQTDFNWDGYDANFWSENYFKTKPLIEFNRFNANIDLAKIKLNFKLIDQAFQLLAEFFMVNNLEIEVCFTNCGSICSFTKVTKNKMLVFPRIDATEEDILKALCALIIRTHPWELSWEDYQTIQNFIIKRSKVSSLLYKTRPTLSTSDYSPLLPKLRDESNNNYSLLGFSSTTCLQIINNTLLINGETEIAFLTNHEYQILSQLVKSKNKVVNFDSIANIIWKDPINEFSLQAISKVIERIRKKLEAHGIHKNIIFTKRGEGYIYSE